MARQKYNLHLKGYVGGWDFESDYVDYILSKNADNEVHVLIDSLGGRSSSARLALPRTLPPRSPSSPLSDARALLAYNKQEPRKGQRPLCRNECFRSRSALDAFLRKNHRFTRCCPRQH